MADVEIASKSKDSGQKIVEAIARATAMTVGKALQTLL
jgi:hypothetical protein